MKVYQIICTNHKKGILQEYCFETVAQSEGITEDEKKEIERRFCIDIHGDDMELVLSAPSYSFFKLESGRYCVCMTKSYGENATDYFCHGLIMDEEFLSFYPVQLMGSPTFKYDFMVEEIEETILPVLSGIQEGQEVTCDRVWQFAGTRLQQGIKDMISAAVDYKRIGKGISILDREENIPLWIGAVTMAFPVKMAHMITFTTSCFNNENGDFLIQGSIGRLVNESQGESRYYEFDYIKGIVSRIGIQYRFMHMVEVGYLVSRRTLEKFHRFLSQFDYEGIDREIDNCYNLYIMANICQSNMNILDIKEAFKFAVRYGSQDVRDDVFQMLEPNMDKIVRRLNIDAAVPAAEYMFKTALDSKKLIIMNRIYYFFYNLVDHLILDYKLIDTEGVFRLYKDTAKLCGDRAHTFFRYSVSRDRINYITNLLSAGCTGEKAEIFLRLVLDSLIALGYLWSQALNIESMGVLMDICIKAIVDSGRDMGFIMETCSADDGFFARLTMFFYNRIKSGPAVARLVEKFTGMLDNMDENRRLGIRKLVYGLEGGSLLLEEFSLGLGKADDKVEFFRQYYKDVFQAIGEYEKLYYSKAVKLYIHMIPAEHVYGESLRIINEIVDGAISIDDEGLKYIIKGFEKGVSLSSPSDELRSIIPEIKKIKKIRGINTSPDVTGLLDFALWVEKIRGQSYPVEEVLEGLPDIETLDMERYKEYINWCIPAVIGFAESAEGHKKIVDLIDTDGREHEFFRSYIKCLEDELNKNRRKGLSIFLHFEVYFFFYLEPRYKILEETEILEQIEGLVEDILLMQPRSFIDEMDRGIKDEFNLRGLSIPLKWNQIYSKIMEKKHKPFMKTLAGIFSREQKE